MFGEVTGPASSDRDEITQWETRVSLSTQDKGFMLDPGPGNSGVCVVAGRSGRWYWLIETSYNLLSLWRDVTTSRLMFSHAGVSVQCVSVCPAIPQFMQWFPLNNIHNTRNNIDRQLWTNNTFNYRFCQGKPSNICVVSRQADINSSGNWVNWRFIVLRERQWKPETVWSVSVCISVSMSWEISVLQPAAPPDTSDRV